MPDLFKDFDSTFARQHDIKQHQIRDLFFEDFIKRFPVSKCLCLKLLAFQGIGHKFTDVLIIFHTVDTRHHHPSFFLYYNTKLE